MPLPADYDERVYAGVLGKIIGVYLGRPFEQWTQREIEERLGEIRGYVTGHPAIAPDKRANPLVVSDDDISGTFTFVRALEDYGPGVTPEQIGQTWLNYVIERRTTLWWGGVGVSTEHTAFLALKDGVRAPASGSAAQHGPVISEQIGAQIFIDGWAMACPGDPVLAADLARRAASVSHDGEAVLGAQVIAAMEAQAFVKQDVDALIDTAVALIPRDSVIFRAIDDIRGWHAAEPDWRGTRARIEQRYGYDRYRGLAHVVPNHALVILALLYGGGDFDRSLAIVNTSGWDTDCNSGNLGCLLGIRGGVAGIGAEWRAPVRDRLYVSSADGGHAISDAATEAVRIIAAGRALAGEPELAPKGGARFHFAFPGSVQGFVGGEHADGALGLPAGAVAVTPTFIPREAFGMTGYELQASPTLYPGQTVRARVEGAACRLLVRVYGGADEPATIRGALGEHDWRVPDTGGRPIAEVGIEASGPARLDSLGWDGAPDVTFTRPADGGTMWHRAWVQAVDRFDPGWPEPFRLIQDRGRGLLIQGTREWTDYEVRAAIVPETIVAAGIAARVQGLRRYYALLLGDDDTVRLLRELDGTVTLAAAPVRRRAYAAPHELALRVDGERLVGSVDGEIVLEARDGALTGGAVALVCEQGCLTCDAVSVGPAQATGSVARRSRRPRSS